MIEQRLGFADFRIVNDKAYSNVSPNKLERIYDHLLKLSRDH